MNTDKFFHDYYNNAEVNSILIMECDGTIRDVNKSFTNNFGYHNEEIAGRNFNILFTPWDKSKDRPQQELETVVSTGQSTDENYVISKEGHAIWCTGESLLVRGEEGKKYIVKDIINLQAKKQLQLFLGEAEDLLERIFAHSKDIPMMILDGSLKVEKVNGAFLQLFDLEQAPATGSRIGELEHPFWKTEDIKRELRQIIVNHEPIKKREFGFESKSGAAKTIRVDSKIIESQITMSKKIFLIIEEINARY